MERADLNKRRARAAAYAYASFAFVGSITPGPNNAMLLSSGLTYGFRRTVPHIAGISLGCAAMLVLAGLGFGAAFVAVPTLYQTLRYISAAYLLWLAWSIARSGPITDRQRSVRPMTFWQAVAFQWVNPKAWILVVGAVGAYAPRDGFELNVAILAVVLGLVNVSCISVWAGFGTLLRTLLSDARRVRMVNLGMAALLVLSLLPILAD